MKKAILFFALVLVAVFFACQKDISSAIQPSVGKASFMTIAKAKAWFDEVEPKTVWTKTEKQEHYKPQWHLAVQLNGAVEVPVLLEDKGIMPTINSSSPKQYGATRLLVASLDGSTIDGAIIKYFPTEKFVGNMEEINRDNFRDKKFDGMIKLENFDFTDQKVVLIEDGKLTYFMANSERRPSVRPRDFEICYRDCYTPVTTVTGGGHTYTSYGTTLICGNQYCVTVPTDFNPNTGNTSNATGGSGGTNNSGAAILGGGAVTVNNELCDDSFVELRAFPTSETEQELTQRTGLINVKIEFTKPYSLNLYSVKFDYLVFRINHNSDPIPGDPYLQMANAFNTAVMETQRDIQLSSNPAGATPIYDNESAGKRFLSYLSIHLTGNLGFLSEAKALASNPNAGMYPMNWMNLTPRTPFSIPQTKDKRIPTAQCTE